MDRPNILLIVIDSARADRFSCYGYEQPTTPNIDRIAGEGVRFDSAYAESSWTLPVCFTLLTGLAPREHLGEGHRTLPQGMPTLPEALKEAGYRSFGGSANTFFGPRCGLQRGFDEFFLPRQTASLTRPFVKYVAQRLGWTDEGGQAVTSRFLSWIDGVEPPWFALLWYNDAHHPYAARQPFTTRFCREPIPFGKRLSLLSRMRRMLDLVATATEEDLRHVSGLYDGGLAYEDMLVGKAREGLVSRGVWDDTVVVITADHGEMLGERGLMGHGRGADMYRPLLQVPLVVRVPGQVDGRATSDALVQLADIAHSAAVAAGVRRLLAPTMAETVELFGEPVGAGRSFAISEREPFGERSLQSAQRKNPRFDFGLQRCHMTAVVEDGWKLIHRADGRHELYDLRDDPAEQTNRMADEPARASELAQRVTDWQQLIRAHPSVEGLAVDDTPIVEKRLQDLGYY